MWCRELAQLNQVAARKLAFVDMLKAESAERERQVGSKLNLLLVLLKVLGMSKQPC